MRLSPKLKWTVWLVILSIAGGGYIGYNMLASDEAVASYMEEYLYNVFNAERVRVERARRKLDGTLWARHVTIYQKIKGEVVPTLQIDRVWIETIGGPLSKPTGVKKVVLDGVHLSVYRTAPQRWSVVGLFRDDMAGQTGTEEALPEIVVRDSRVVLIDATTGEPREVLELSDFQMQLAPDAQLKQYSVTGEFHGTSFVGGSFRGRFDPRTLETHLAGSLERLALSDQLRKRLPPELIGWWDRLKPSAGSVTLRADLRHDPSAGEPIRYEVVTEVANASVQLRELPFPLDDLDARIVATNDNVQLQRLTARAGVTSVECQGEVSGLSDDADLDLTGKVTGLLLDDRLRASLPAEWQRQWDRIEPGGQTDVDLKLQRRSGKWTHDLVVTCRDASVRPKDFPLAIHRITGRLKAQPERLEVSLAGFAGHRRVSLTGYAEGPLEEARLDLKLVATGVPIDEPLLAAVDAGTAAWVRKFDLPGQGNFNLVGKLQRAAGPDQPADWEAEITLNRCRGKYFEVPYPLSDVSGTVRIRTDPTPEMPDRMTLTVENVTGTNDVARIELNGIEHFNDTWRDLRLSIKATDVAFEPELKRALLKEWRDAWDQFDPTGTADFTADLRAVGGWDEVAKATVTIDLKKCSLRYTGFPYPFQNVTGRVIIDSEKTQLVNLKAKDDSTEFVVSGIVRSPAEGETVVDLTKVDIIGVPERRLLMRALPGPLASGWEALAWTDSFSVHGARATLRLNPKTQQLVEATWEAVIECEKAKFNCGLPATDVSGKIRIRKGSYRGGKLVMTGEIDLAAMALADQPLKNVTASFRLDDTAVAFSNLKGSYFDGRMVGRANLDWSGPLAYRVSLGLVGVDLSDMAKHIMDEKAKLTGRLDARLSLSGREGPESLQGEGMLSITNGDLYRLPLLLRIVNILRLRLPDRRGFTNANIRYYLKDGQFVFQDINLESSALNLRGGGTMRMDGKVRLVLDTTISRRKGGLLNAVGRQLLGRVEVVGPLEEPNVTYEPVPAASGPLRKVIDLLD